MGGPTLGLALTFGLFSHGQIGKKGQKGHKEKGDFQRSFHLKNIKNLELILGNNYFLKCPYLAKPGFRLVVGLHVLYATFVKGINTALDSEELSAFAEV